MTTAEVSSPIEKREDAVDVSQLNNVAGLAFTLRIAINDDGTSV